MQRIFKEYGGVITAAIAIVLLIGIVTLTIGGPNGGWIGGAFKSIITDTVDKAGNKIEGGSNATPGETPTTQPTEPPTEAPTEPEKTYTGNGVYLKGINSSSVTITGEANSTVTVYGKNMLPATEMYTSYTSGELRTNWSGATLTSNGDGTFVLNGTNTNGVSGFMPVEIDLIPGVKYTGTMGLCDYYKGDYFAFKATYGGKENSWARKIDGAETENTVAQWSPDRQYVCLIKSVTTKTTTKGFFVSLVDSDATPTEYENLTIAPMLCVAGADLTTFEEYIAPTTITLDADGKATVPASQLEGKTLISETEMNIVYR